MINQFFIEGHEECQQRDMVSEEQLNLVGLVLALLVLTGLLRQNSDFMIVVDLCLSQTLAIKQKNYLVGINSSIDTILGWCFLFRLFFIKQFAFHLIWLAAFTKPG